MSASSDFAVVVVPKVNANDQSVEVLHWYVADGARVEKSQDLLDLGTSKANVTIQSDFAGFVRHVAQKGEMVAIGATLAQVYPTSEAAAKAAIKKDAPALSTPSKSGGSLDPGGYGFTRLTPAAEKLAAEMGLSPEVLKGMGLVSEKVLRKVLAQGGIPDSPSENRNDLVKRSAPIDRIKRLEIESLTAGQAGNITSSVSVQFSSAKLFEELKRRRAMNGAILPLILHEFSRLLAKSPEFTAYYSNGQIHYYDRVNLGLALDMGSGLKVAVIRDANDLKPDQIYEKITEISLKYASDELTLEDVSEGTVTVTDLSGQGVLSFQPLLNRDQAVILGVGGDATQEGRPMTLTLVFDHRVLTGREAATFLNALKKRLLGFDFSLLG